jgi:NitT/TauT family transport system substrate-binding protein
MTSSIGKLLRRGVALLLSAGVAAGSAEAAGLEKIKLVHGNPLMLQTLYELYVPLAMGWWKDDGLDVDILFSQGSSAAVQNIIGGGASIGLGNTTPWLAADVKGLADIRMLATTRNSSWRVLTLEGSGITKPEDLKGKTVGLAVAGSGGAMYLETMLKENGLDPRRDVRQVVIGLGAQANDALLTKRVDASLTFMGEIAAFQALYPNGRYFVNDAWLRFPDYGFYATKAYIDQRPDVLEKIARGMVKAQVFADANPECVARIFRKNYGGANRPLTLAQDTAIARANSEETSIVKQQSGEGLYSLVSQSGLDGLQTFLKDNDVIKDTIDPAKFTLADPKAFAQKINSFDQDAVRRQAKDCAGY